MSEAKLLRALADKIEHLEAIQEFSSEITEPGDLTVSWTNGHEGAGYGALSEAISDLVKTHWSALRSQVVKQREGEVQTARSEWSSHGNPKKAADTTQVATITSTAAGTEAALRKAAA